MNPLLELALENTQWWVRGMSRFPDTWPYLEQYHWFLCRIHSFWWYCKLVPIPIGDGNRLLSSWRLSLGEAGDAGSYLNSVAKTAATGYLGPEEGIMQDPGGHSRWAGRLLPGNRSVSLVWSVAGKLCCARDAMLLWPRHRYTDIARDPPLLVCHISHRCEMQTIIRPTTVPARGRADASRALYRSCDWRLGGGLWFHCQRKTTHAIHAPDG